jgi:hypothetical protein
VLSGSTCEAARLGTVFRLLMFCLQINKMKKREKEKKKKKKQVKKNRAGRVLSLLLSAKDVNIEIVTMQVFW